MVCAEIGYHEASVERVLAHAGVSRRTFYDLFEDRESCFIAAYDEIMTHVITLIVGAFAEGDSVEPRMKRSPRRVLPILHRGTRGGTHLRRRGAGRRLARARTA